MTKASIETASIRDLHRLWYAVNSIAATAYLGEAGLSCGYVTETASRLCNEADEIRLEIRNELLRRPVEGLSDGERCWRTQMIVSYAVDSGEPGEIFQELVRVGASSLAGVAA